jgi:hypothetical protein
MQEFSGSCEDFWGREHDGTWRLILPEVFIGKSGPEKIDLGVDREFAEVACAFA